MSFPPLLGNSGFSIVFPYTDYVLIAVVDSVVAVVLLPRKGVLSLLLWKIPSKYMIAGMDVYSRELVHLHSLASTRVIETRGGGSRMHGWELLGG